MKYVFKKNDRAVLWGRIASSGDFTMSFKVQFDRDTDTRRSATFGSGGNINFGIGYPYITFGTYNDNMRVPLNGVRDYAYLRPYVAEGEYSPERIVTFKLKADVKQILVDGVVVASRSAKDVGVSSFIKAFDVDFYLSSFSQIDEFTGSIEPVFKPSFDTATPVMVAIKFDKREFHPNYEAGTYDYSNVPRAINQVIEAPDPRYDSRVNLPELGLGINLRYAVGYMNEEMSITELFNRVYAMQKVLSEKNNYAIRLSDAMEETEEEKRLGHPCLAEKMAELAATMPNVRCDVTTAWAHIKPLQGMTPVDVSKLKPTSPLTMLDNDKAIIGIQADCIHEIATRYGIKIGLHIEDNEKLKSYRTTNPDGTYPPANHLADSKAYTEQVIYLLSSLRAKLTDLKVSSEYDVHYTFWDLDKIMFSERIKISINHWGTCSMYCNTFHTWYDRETIKMPNGQWLPARGIGFLLASKYQEIKDGYSFNMPFISGGWDGVEERNLGCAQLMAMYKLAFGAGALTAFPSFFTLTGSGNTGFQKDQSYAKDLIIPSLAQAVFSNPEVYDLMMNGQLLDGDILEQYVLQGHCSYNTGTKSIKTIVRKHNTLEKYLIISAHMPLSRYATPTKKYQDVYITINGVKVYFHTRRQGSVLIYEPGKPVKYFDGWHRAAHIGWWNILSATPEALEAHDED